MSGSASGGATAGGGAGSGGKERRGSASERGAAGCDDGHLSQHPVDRLILELIQSGRDVTTAEIDRIIGRIAGAPFNPRSVRVPQYERGARYRRYTLDARAPSLAYHLVKRVAIERQWAAGTTPDSYVMDLQAAVRDPLARLAVYERRGDHVAVTVTPTDVVLPSRRRGPQRLANLLVIYSADRGIIVTGYQFSTLEAAGIPKEARW